MAKVEAQHRDDIRRVKLSPSAFFSCALISDSCFPSPPSGVSVPLPRPCLHQQPALHAARVGRHRLPRLRSGRAAHLPQWHPGQEPRADLPLSLHAALRVRPSRQLPGRLCGQCAAAQHSADNMRRSRPALVKGSTAQGNGRPSPCPQAGGLWCR